MKRPAALAGARGDGWPIVATTKAQRTSAPPRSKAELQRERTGARKRRKVARTRTPSNSELGARIASRVRTLASIAAGVAAAPESARSDAERRLLAAWEALQPSPWSSAMTQAQVRLALDGPRRMLACRAWDEELALQRALLHLRGVVADPWAPEGLLPPDTRLTRAVLLAREQRGGRLHAGQSYFGPALLALLRQMRVSNATSTRSVSRSGQRQRQKRRRPEGDNLGA
jgi:hypothetical protein